VSVLFGAAAVGGAARSAADPPTSKAVHADAMSRFITSAIVQDRFEV
jgi:hypothetical protein